MSLSYDRVERLKLIESLLPTADQGASVGFSSKQIIEKLANSNPDLILTARTIQRDLKDLISAGRVALHHKSENSPTYVQVAQDDEIDGPVWEYFIEHLKVELEGIVSNTDLAKLITRLKKPDDGIALDEKKICILPDSLRLKPAVIDYRIFSSVLKALKERLSVRIRYKDRQENVSEPTLHPLGIMQRGPRIYLVALKDDGGSERLYAVDRILKVELLGTSDKKTGSFCFADYIARGKADFSDGEMIELKAVVSGYVETLLYDCPLNDSQKLIPMQEGEDGSLLTVTIPSSGQLLRWILSCGSNIKLLSPDELSVTVRDQIKKTYRSYFGSIDLS
ncbi:helix-turn-helix transcriptional regulator [Undibacterium curvum]|uniref:WYL domain-containing protein n=1 Tax=Undibacterium curvum TaxID=2762294 RepID=A0ABR7A113_9BURK|nr:WYL domain-containing protein [Undibacterium curvum]MBC3930599.1 WYL domain-containing protein [Undibacterium curvum]